MCSSCALGASMAAGVSEPTARGPRGTLRGDGRDCLRRRDCCLALSRLEGRPPPGTRRRVSGTGEHGTGGLDDAGDLEDVQHVDRRVLDGLRDRVTDADDDYQQDQAKHPAAPAVTAAGGSEALRTYS